MPKTAKAKTGMLKDRYWSGVFTGVFLGCFMLSAAIVGTVRFQGVKVAINPETMSKLVQEKVRIEVRKSIPQLLEGFKKELPAEVHNHLSELDGLKIGFGQSEVKLPEEILGAIKSEFNRIIETAIINTLNNYNTMQYEERMAQSAYEMVDHILRQDIIGKTYLIKSMDWFTVPIKIVSSSSQSLKIEI